MAPKVIAKPCTKCGSTEKVSNGPGEVTCGPCRRARRRVGAGHRPARSGSVAVPVSIDEFLMQKKRAVCPVCRLADPVRALVSAARKGGKRQAEIIEYLQVCHRVKIAPPDFARHGSERHEQ